MEALKSRLAAWPDRKVEKASDARNLILALADLAYGDKVVQDKASFAVVLALEFAFGACTGLDDYTLYLTPQHYNTIQAALHGKFVGVGIDLAIVDQQLEITRVYPNSPAWGAGMQVHDRIVRIDQQAVEKMRPEDVAELLRGKPDSWVELEVAGRPEPYKLQRKPVVVPSVEWRMESMGEGDYIGVVKITHFQDTTLKEVQEALADMQSQGIKGLILDLRGNPGGSYPAAKKVAELFIPDGVIVNSTSRIDGFNGESRVTGTLNPLLMPMCVFIDYETASSAELLAGALKENRRASVILLGQTTFGKGSIQAIIPLKKDKALGGIRITIAKFTSPSKKEYANLGVTPDISIDVPRRNDGPAHQCGQGQSERDAFARR